MSLPAATDPPVVLLDADDRGCVRVLSDLRALVDSLTAGTLLSRGG